MASLLDEPTQKTIAEILEVDPIYLSVHLDAYTDYITAVTVTKVNALLTRWTDNNLDTDFLRIEGNVANLGANIDSDDLRDDIRAKLAALLVLHRAKWWTGTNSSEVMMERG